MITNFEEVRAIADSKSLKLRFSDKKILDKFKLNESFQKTL